MGKTIDSDELLRAVIISKEFTDGDVLILKDIIKNLKPAEPDAYIVTEQGDLPVRIVREVGQ